MIFNLVYVNNYLQVLFKINFSYLYFISYYKLFSNTSILLMNSKLIKVMGFYPSYYACINSLTLPFGHFLLIMDTLHHKPIKRP